MSTPEPVAGQRPGDVPGEPAPLGRQGWWIQVTAERTPSEICHAHCPWLLATDCDLEAGHQGDHAYLLTWRGDRGLDPRGGAGA